MIATEEQTLSVREFADEMGWDVTTVTRAIKAGRVHSANEKADGLMRVKAYRIPRSEVERIRHAAALERAAQTGQ